MFKNIHKHICDKTKYQSFAGDEVKIRMWNFNRRSHNEKDNEIIENMTETINSGWKYRMCYNLIKKMKRSGVKNSHIEEN